MECFFMVNGCVVKVDEWFQKVRRGVRDAYSKFLRGVGFSGKDLGDQALVISGTFSERILGITAVVNDDDGPFIQAGELQNWVEANVAEAGDGFGFVECDIFAGVEERGAVGMAMEPIGGIFSGALEPKGVEFKTDPVWIGACEEVIDTASTFGEWLEFVGVGMDDEAEVVVVEMVGDLHQPIGCSHAGVLVGVGANGEPGENEGAMAEGSMEVEKTIRIPFEVGEGAMGCEDLEACVGEVPLPFGGGPAVVACRFDISKAEPGHALKSCDRIGIESGA